jgi:L-alanine-DL-glutamate epimerase-like enolase superfamily enzyme
MHYDLVTSIELSKVLSGIGINWLEDPVPVMDLISLSELRKKSKPDTHLCRRDVHI